MENEMDIMARGTVKVTVHPDTYGYGVSVRVGFPDCIGVEDLDGHYHIPAEEEYKVLLLEGAVTFRPHCAQNAMGIVEYGISISEMKRLIEVFISDVLVHVSVNRRQQERWLALED